MGCVSKRVILWHLVFWGFAVNYMIRINVNIAIVAMVAPRRQDAAADVVIKESECFVAEVENTAVGSEVDNLTSSVQDQQVGDVFPWDEHQQGLVLGSFFWFHWTTQLPGGILARKYGTKLVFGVSNLLISVASLLTPVTAYWDYRALVVLRVMQGVIGGVCWPSMHNLATSWIPPNERSKFFTSYLGSSVGAGLTFPFCGLVISRFGWAAAFYVTAAIGCLWFLAWWSLVHDSPAQHPHIDPAERRFIEDSLGSTLLRDKPPVPWRQIRTSRTVWYTIVAHIGGITGMFTILIQAPSYFKFVHGWDVRMAGFLSGLPHFSRVLFALVFSSVADGLLKREKVRRRSLRKFATLVSTVGQGVLVVGLAFCGCDWLAAVLCCAAAVSLHGAVSTGTLAVFADISPNYASIVLGLSGTVAVIPGILSPLLVAALTYHNQSVAQWRLVFLIVSGISCACGLVFVCLADPVLQPWNDPDKMAAEGGDQRKRLRLSRRAAEKATAP